MIKLPRNEALGPNEPFLKTLQSSEEEVDLYCQGTVCEDLCACSSGGLQVLVSRNQSVTQASACLASRRTDLH